MKRREKAFPFMTQILLIYNIITILMNGWIVMKVVKNQFKEPIGFFCNGDNRRDSDMIYV